MTIQPMPTITCIVPTTKRRQSFWPMLFRCFQRQTWPNKELVLVSEDPVNSELPPRTRIVTVSQGTSIGNKMNIGVESSNSNYFCKIDDDDWYHRDFLSASVPALIQRTPSITMMNTYLMLFLKSWELRYLPRAHCAGGTICFDRAAWIERRFEDLNSSEDWNFVDNRNCLVRIGPGQVLASYLIVRHGSNSWNDWNHTTIPGCNPRWEVII